MKPSAGGAVYLGGAASEFNAKGAKEWEEGWKALEDKGDGTFAVIGAALAVHRELGPGLLESAYRSCLAHELRRRGLSVAAEVPLAVPDRGDTVEVGYRLDLVVDGRLLVELKSVRRLEPIHLAQVLTYLRFSGLPLALLINFDVPLLKNGIRRVLAGRPHRPF